MELVIPVPLWLAINRAHANKVIHHVLPKLSHLAKTLTNQRRGVSRPTDTELEKREEFSHFSPPDKGGCSLPPPPGKVGDD
jgi:hypothetical protein